MGWILLLLIVLPIAEIWLIGVVGNAIGFVPAFALLFVVSALGAWLAKREGLRVFRDWQLALAEGRVPDAGVVDGFLILAGGVLLIVPGFITDALGLLLVIPPTRRVAASLARRWVQRGIDRGTIRVVTRVDANPPPRESEGVIQGRVVEDDRLPPATEK